MTRAEAIQEARRRWGPKGKAAIATGIGPWSGLCLVGPGSIAGLPIGGKGRTWEEAFRDADSLADRVIIGIPATPPERTTP